MSFLLGPLDAILCWIQQIGAMVLNSLIDIVNLLFAGIGVAGSAIIAAWPIGMPSLPDMPSQLQTAFEWIAWSPFPWEALGAFVAFVMTVYIAIAVVGPILRWLRVLG